MKYLKVSVTKSIAGGGIKFTYPEGYNAQEIMVEAYEHSYDDSKLEETEWVYGKANDTFPENGVSIISLAKEDYLAELTQLNGGS